MTNKYKFILAGIALLGAYSIGRWAAPEKVRVEKQIVEVEKKSESKDIEKNTKKTTTTTKTTHPDGTVDETTTVVEETDRKSSKTDTTETDKNETDIKEITRSSSKVTLSALGGLGLSTGLPVYGASISKPILGPITVGAFYLTPGILGASIGLTF